MKSDEYYIKKCNALVDNGNNIIAIINSNALLYFIIIIFFQIRQLVILHNFQMRYFNNDNNIKFIKYKYYML